MMKLKKGTYYVGDPCYIFDKSWDGVLDQTDFFTPDSIQEVFGEECFVVSSGGDGCFYDNQGRKYFVDSGSIGVMPIDLIKIDNKVSLEEVITSSYMHEVEFEEDFEVFTFYGGVTFGNLTIAFDEVF